jgi:hypothetical protein
MPKETSQGTIEFACSDSCILALELQTILTHESMRDVGTDYYSSA